MDCRTVRTFILCAVLGLLVSAANGAIYYINDGGQTNASGSTFVTTTGSWSVSSSSSYPAYGGDYTHSVGGDATGTFTFGGPAGCYYVYAGWSPPDNPASRTQDGTITVTGPNDSIMSYPVNHEKRADGVTAGKNYTGSGFFPVQTSTVQKPITMGAGSTITYTDGTETPNNDRIAADVVVLSTDMLIDDLSTLTSQTTAYTLSENPTTNVLGEFCYGYNYIASPAVTDVFTYNIGAALPEPTAKELKVSWYAASSRDQLVNYRVTHAEGVTDVPVNQRRLADASLPGSPVWSGFRTLGTFSLDANSKLEIIPRGGGQGSVSADTIALANTPEWDIAANFNAENTTADTDGYAGKAGNGWANAWNAYAASPTVTRDNPIGNEGDKFLSVPNTSSNPIVRRKITSTDDIDITQPHTVSWQWRFDGNWASVGGDANDRIHFFAAADAQSGTNSGNAWLLGMVAHNSFHEGNWYAFDGGSSSSWGVGNHRDSGMAVQPDTVYDFKVVVDPIHGTYDTTITDGITTVTMPHLTFRNRTTLADGVSWDYLHFGGNANSASDNIKFALDSVRVNSSPCVVANFSDGNTPGTIDTYTGSTGGAGWVGGWSTYGTSDVTVTPTVSLTDPLGSPCDPYLSVTASGAGDRTLRRHYEAYGDLDPAKPHRISWTWRFDGDPADLNSVNDRIHFFGQDNAHSGSGADNSWLIGWVAADGSYDIHEGHWYFYDRVDGSFNKGNMVNTGLELDPDAIYDFAVTVYPDLGTYDAWLSDGTNRYGATGLTFRNGDTGVYDWIHFGGCSSADGDDWAFSLDSVKIEYVPEPATIGLLLGGLAALARRRRRH